MPNFTKTHAACAALTLATLGLSAPAYAEDGGSSPRIEYSGYVSMLTDYRLRGASLSDNKPVIQGAVEAAVPVSGNFALYGGVWSSSLDKEAGAGAMETDFYIGAKGKIGNVSIKARYLRLVFHDVDNLDFDQFEAGISAPVGALNVGAGVIHDEYQGGGHSTYTFTHASYNVPKTKIGVNALVGYENGTNWDNKLNWQVGASYGLGPVSLSASYIDTNRTSLNSRGGNRAGSTMVFAVSGNF